MKPETHEITCNPHFLEANDRFNIEAQVQEINGKIHSLDYCLTFPRPKPEPEPIFTIIPEPINISLNDLLKICARYFGVTMKEVKGKFRGGNVMKARLIYMAMARKECGYKLKYICKLVNKDHASVSNACKSVFKDEIYPDERITLKEHYQKVIDIIQDKTI